MNDAQLYQVVAIIIVLFLGIGLHEYAHCKVADLCGDPTPRYYGRVTLNLTKHFEVTGTLMMIFSAYTGIGLGWGKAAPIDPRKMRDPKWDLFAAVAAGPISNIFQAVIYGLLYRMTLNFAPNAFAGDSFLFALLTMGVFVNLTLALFNLIPFGPLDGHWLVGQLLPEKQSYHWYRFNRTIGFMGLLIVITVLNQIAINGGPDILGAIIGRPRAYLFELITGLDLS